MTARVEHSLAWVNSGAAVGSILDAIEGDQETVRFALVLLVVAAFLFPQSIVAQQTKAVRRVLIFNDFGSISSPGVAILDQAIAAGLARFSIPDRTVQRES